MKKVFFFISILLSTIIAVAQPKIGEQSPDIALPDVNGAVQKLSDLKGKVVLIDFWASWCGPCRRANPGLVELYSKYKSKGFEIYGVSIDDKKDAWKKAIAADKITWKQVNEAGGWDAPIALKWKLEQIPASFLLDQQGKVIALDPGKDDIEAQLKKLLK